MTTAELSDEWLALKRDLEQHGYTVLPDRPLPLDHAQAAEHVRGDLERAQLSVHLVGSTYSLVPEGGRESLIELQYELAVRRSAQGQFARLVWIPPNLEVEDERQQRLVQSLRMDPRTHGDADLLETPLEDLRTVIAAWLAREPEGDAPPRDAATSDSPPQLYLMYDKRDQAAVMPWADHLFKARFEVLHPLRACAGTLIFYGSANEAWLRRKLREVKKSVGYGRASPPVVAVGVVGDRTPEKERFRTHEAMLVPQWTDFSPELLQPFMDRVRQECGPAARDGASDPA
jgi:hypothetical protein